MKNQFWTLLLVGIVLTFLVSACEKSASLAPISTPTANSNPTFTTPLPSSAFSSILAGTQTAEVLTSPTEVKVDAATPTAKVNLATATPAAEVSVATTTPTAEINSTNTPLNPTATPTVVIVANTSTSTSHNGIPTFSITKVEANSTVTISADNFPPNDTFDVLMGSFGTKGIGGIIVTSFNSGAGGSFTATYNIPAALKGLQQIAIRLQDTTGYYYTYNWFWNTTT
jgi:hypothetical protein